jgi:uncharacterized protein YukJ
MPLKKYGVLKGTVLGHLRDADDDHYQILIKAGPTLYRIAVNVLSAAKNAPSILLFQTATIIPAKWKGDNGVYQDGAIFVEYPGDKWRAFFFAFQSQTFDTDNKGNPHGGAPKLTTPKKKGKKAKKGRKGGK